MYILNVDDLGQKNIFSCNGIIANWLIKKNIPLLGKSGGGQFCFMKTDLLEEVLEGLPFWYNLTSHIF
jgi:hypothetical protein